MGQYLVNMYVRRSMDHFHVLIRLCRFPERVGRVVIDGVADADVWTSERSLSNCLSPNLALRLVCRLSPLPRGSNLAQLDRVNLSHVFRRLRQGNINHYPHLPG